MSGSLSESEWISQIRLISRIFTDPDPKMRLWDSLSRYGISWHLGDVRLITALIALGRFCVSTVFQKSKKPAWKSAGRVNEVSSRGCPPLSDGTTKWCRLAGVLDKADKIAPEARPAGRGLLRTNETQH